MKTLTLEEFKILATSSEWVREQNHDVIDNILRPAEKWDEDVKMMAQIDIPHTFGSITLTSKLSGITIIYNTGFNYDDNMPDTLSVGCEGLDKVWESKGLRVFDEDGDCLLDADLADYLTIDFEWIDESQIMTLETADVDADEESEMDTITLEIDNQPSLRFKGEVSASTSSSENNASGNYSGESGRWTDLVLYKTAGGKYVCHQIGHSIRGSERTRYSGEVCETVEGVIRFFGHRWLAKDLYESAGIDDTVNVE